ncbi:hypothetical protein LH464_05200 [Neorhizobium sp. T786]|uniref:hypothetical protein n=1 Tax=Pseudorhizobium xiangyangii TaxID=2883104 RepID=UPI001CFFF9ED|nr:hypothetical protein [Neorhizobium xiangyangii]MCB5201874.1 hypothetical protein [Neorhizobium xiangyangii]
MTERFFVGNDGGAFKLRVSKPGITARNATVDQCFLHEGGRPLAFVAQGSLGVGNGGSASVALGRSFAYPPVVVLRCATNRTAGRYATSGGTTGYYATLNMASGVLTIFNQLGYTDTFKYVVFIPS